MFAGSAHGVHESSTIGIVDVLPAAVALAAIAIYAIAAHGRGTDARPWPPHRTVLWCVGVLLAAAPVVPPLADSAHGDLVNHMVMHVVSTMLAPVFLVLAAPTTLALRSLSVTPARRLSRVMRSAPARALTHPVIAVSIAASGMWVIYTTPLFTLMMSEPLAHLVIHTHMVIAGFLLTWVAIGIDPRPHPPPPALVGAMLVAAMAAHSVLAKTLYATPPIGVGVVEGREAAQIMHYGGAWVEAIVIVIFWVQWYRPRAQRFGRDERCRQSGVARAGVR